jgi:hypothetical protein
MPAKAGTLQSITGMSVISLQEERVSKSPPGKVASISFPTSTLTGAQLLKCEIYGPFRQMGLLASIQFKVKYPE